MKKLLVGLAAVPFLAGIAIAGQPMPLSEVQMEKVTAGGGPSLEIEITSFPGPVEINHGPTLFNVEVGPDVASPRPGFLEHFGDPADALGGLLCNSSCVWGNT